MSKRKQWRKGKSNMQLKNNSYYRKVALKNKRKRKIQKVSKRINRREKN